MGRFSATASAAARIGSARRSRSFLLCVSILVTISACGGVEESTPGMAPLNVQVMTVERADVLGRQHVGEAGQQGEVLGIDLLQGQDVRPLPPDVGGNRRGIGKAEGQVLLVGDQPGGGVVAQRLVEGPEEGREKCEVEEASDCQTARAGQEHAAEGDGQQRGQRRAKHPEAVARRVEASQEPGRDQEGEKAYQPKDQGSQHPAAPYQDVAPRGA